MTFLFVQFVNGKGELTEETPFAGIVCEESRSGSAERLWMPEDSCLLHRSLSMSTHTAGDATHRLIYYARESWYIK